MSFPHDDPAWAETAGFLRPLLAAADRVVAPDPFRWAIPRAERFGAIGQAAPGAFAFVVVHKGELDRIPAGFLAALPGAARPVFGNPVFVVFATRADPALPDLSDSDHVRAFLVAWEERVPAPDFFALDLPEPAAPAPEPTLPPPPPPPVAAQRPPSPRRPPPARLTLPVPPRPWLTPGGVPGTAREAAFQQELDRLIAAYLGPATDLAVLDIACGIGRLAALLPGAASITGIDLSEPALASARARHAGQSGRDFARMDAARLAFPDSSFDAAVLIDAIEALADPAAALTEAARVLPEGGRLMLSAMNRESLFLRAQRRLGLAAPEGLFCVTELTGMLRVAGFQPIRSDGLFLSPGWALPGAAGGLAELEEDPEFIAAARRLGRRAGPEDALGFVLLARRE